MSRPTPSTPLVQQDPKTDPEAVLRQALEARGVPARLYVDNGAPFASGQLGRICAHLGIRLAHSAPGRPEGRGKIERFFRTLRDQFLVELGQRERLELRELNRLLGAFIEQVYHRRAHSETEQPPLERFASAQPRYPTASELREAFLWWCDTRSHITSELCGLEDRLMSC